jgi:hypothetical protein
MKKTYIFELRVKNVGEPLDSLQRELTGAIDGQMIDNQKFELTLKETILQGTPIEYPVKGALFIKKVVVQFNRGLCDKGARRAREIAEYWGSLPFVGQFHGSFVSNGNTFLTIYVDVSETTSHDVAKREILEILNTLLEEGTPERKTQGYTRAVEAVGNVVCVQGLM